MFSFLKKPKPEELVKKWKRDLKREERQLDLQIRGIDNAERKTTMMIKERVKAGDHASAKTLAKEIVKSRQAKERMYTAKASMNSVAMQLQSNLAMAKVAGNLAKSTEIMKLMNNLVKLPELNKIMMAMGSEMTKAGIMEEMISDVFDTQNEELEEDAQMEVDKIMDEILKTGPQVSSTPLETPQQQQQVSNPKEDEELFNRLKALKTG
ncbi:SNF7 family protein [Tieghemostelium lacteum]|uniref:SNF7 family protein n=1 Tax=Tieghemostelium lacteum TaxID=361077 RepID=A0A151ZSM3_TIELA|nr:SNF7 family protein [Tieghemostelium lacteum]|eukprot:KYQ96939.1 SNF7 family protein [Tieghemostelium lacteum]